MIGTIDYLIIGFFLVALVGISLYYTKQAGQNMTNFFLGGRKLSWWLAGTSMVATTFAADTPLLITELVAHNGISGNWIWWNGAIGGLLAAFFFSRYWHKAGILTDVEFIELRYSGLAAKYLRGFKALYLGLLMNVIIIAWVNLALITFLVGLFDLSHEVAFIYMVCIMGLVVLYSALSGFLGIVITDFIQFSIAMVGCILLAIFVIRSPEIGNIENLKALLPKETFSFLPKINFSVQNLNTHSKSLTISVATFFSFIAVQWWASWYPGSEPGGGGYIAQRMMSTKKESSATKATLFFQIAHHCLRPWPWIIVALASLVLYPDLGEHEKRLGYVYTIRDFLPTGLKGLIIVGFLSAYMSTISTQFNWGTGYLVHDFYKRFLKPQASQKQLIVTARIFTFVIMFISVVVTSYLETLTSAFLFVIEASAGLGLVLILRWYWWRVNVWSEITASVMPILIFICLSYTSIEHPYSLFITVSITTLIWLLITYITPTTSDETLKKFCQQVKPIGFWNPVYKKMGLTHLKLNSKPTFRRLLFMWIASILMLYALLFGIGTFIFGQWSQAAGLLIFAFLIAYILNKQLKKM